MRKTALLLLILPTLSLFACHKQKGEPIPAKPIVVLYENDVHCGIDGYAKFAGLRDAMVSADTAYVLTVSSGDYVQGGATGTLSQGGYIIDIMNAVRYDAVTIGNHEFDYGTPRLLQLVTKLNAPMTCVNLSLVDSAMYFAPYIMRTVGTKKIAFVGVVTPSTFVSERAAFYDADGKQIYDLHISQLYDLVQQSVDKARKNGADYVVLLSHMGEKDADITSITMIEAISGVDVVLDGHTHSEIEQQMVNDKTGTPVILTQTGTKFTNIGKLYIGTDGKMNTSLLPTAQVTESSARVVAVVDSINALNATQLNKVIGHSDVTLTIYDADGKRLVRHAETNAGDYVADAFRAVCGTQIATVNGGGVRADLPAGDVTYGKILEVLPFNNTLDVIMIQGKVLRQMLEWGSSHYPDDSGDFVQPSGFRYTIDTTLTSRIGAIEIYNEEKNAYEALDEEAYYKMAIQSYSRTQYNGLLTNCELVASYICADAEAFRTYLVEILGGQITAEKYGEPQGRIIIK